MLDLCRRSAMLPADGLSTPSLAPSPPPLALEASEIDERMEEHSRRRGAQQGTEKGGRLAEQWAPIY